MRRYEGMFVVDSAVSAKDFNAVRGHIHRILEKAGAEIQASDRWDERKLAYELNGVKRGTYILSYFLLETEAMFDLNQQLELSDIVIRHLVQQRERPVNDGVRHCRNHGHHSAPLPVSSRRSDH